MNATIRFVRRATAGASVIRLEWRRVAQWAGVLAGVAVLGGCVPGGTKPPSETQLVAVAHNPAPPFSAGVFPTTAPPHRLGDEVGFALTTDTAGYGHLYLLNASGTVVALVENAPVAAGVPATFPSPGGAYRLRASPPAGTERVLFLVTRERFAGFSGGVAASAPVTLGLGAAAFVKNLNAVTARLASDGWALAEVRLEVLPATG